MSSNYPKRLLLSLRNRGLNWQTLAAATTVLSGLYLVLAWLCVGSINPLEVRRWVEARIVTPDTSEKLFSVIVADLNNDTPDKQQTRRLWEALSQMGGFEVILKGETLSLESVGKSRQIAGKTLRNKAVLWMDSCGADIVIWGNFYEGHFELGIEPRTLQASGQLKAHSITNLTIDSTLNDRMRDVLSLVIYTNTYKAKTGTYLVEHFRPLLPKLKTYASQKDLTQDQRAQAWHSIAVAYGIIGEQTGENEALSSAVTAFHSALEGYTQERTPIYWAMTQNNLGTALFQLGMKTSCVKTLKQAIKTYQEALKVYTRDGTPLAWATTQNNLGAALQTLGLWAGDTKTLKQAVRAHLDALEVYTRKDDPLVRAATQNNLGTALQIVGELERDTHTLELAIEAHQGALTVYTRNGMPLDWATTQNNLGAALQALGERKRDIATIKLAIKAHQNALKELTRERLPLVWAATQFNLGYSQCIYAKMEGNSGQVQAAIIHLNKALAAYREYNQQYDIWRAEKVIEKAHVLFSALDKDRETQSVN